MNKFKVPTYSEHLNESKKEKLDNKGLKVIKDLEKEFGKIEIIDDVKNSDCYFIDLGDGYQNLQILYQGPASEYDTGFVVYDMDGADYVEDPTYDSKKLINGIKKAIKDSK